MLRKKKRLTLAILTTLIVLGGAFSVFIYFNSATYLVNKIEDEWDILLPNPAQKLYRSNETFIDGSVSYLAYSLFYEPDDDYFTAYSPLISKTEFAAWFNEALNSFSRTKSVPAPYLPNLNNNYEYLFFSKVSNIRYHYLFIIFVPTTLTMYVCNEVRQYAHV